MKYYVRYVMYSNKNSSATCNLHCIIGTNQCLTIVNNFILYKHKINDRCPFTKLWIRKWAFVIARAYTISYCHKMYNKVAASLIIIVVVLCKVVFVFKSWATTNSSLGVFTTGWDLSGRAGIGFYFLATLHALIVLW